MKVANESPQIAAMAYEIADSCARSDIECSCVAEEVEGVRWYITAPDLVANEFVEQAVEYLEARGLLNRHATRRELVNFDSEVTA